MTVSLSALEIVQLATGEIVVRRAGKDEEPLLKLDFSEEATRYLAGSTMDVARAMVKAGIEAAFEAGLGESELQQLVDEVETEEAENGVRTLH